MYRNAHHDHFSGVDKYFTPFLSPNQNRALNPKEIKDVLPENNKEIPLVPQILTNRGEFFCAPRRSWRRGMDMRRST